MRPLIPAFACLLVAACAPTVLVQRPAEGYRAIRITETQRFDYGPGYMEVAAGSVYVADRTRSDGVMMWCDAARQSPMDCLLWDGTAITLRADGSFPAGPFQMRPGTVEEFRLH